MRTGTKPSAVLEWAPEALLAGRCVADWPADRARVEILADPPVLLAWLWWNAGHGVRDRVPRAQRGLGRRGVYYRRLGGRDGVRTPHRGKQSCLRGKGAEHAGLSWLAAARDDDRAGQPRARDPRLGRSLGQR